jgi:hypothetical protein
VDDWRLMGQEAYLQGRSLTLKVWRPYREGWDHDHCEFCQRHISVPLASDDEDAVDRGYVTEDDYSWVCETCFADFHVQFGWSVVQTPARPE